MARGRQHGPGLLSGGEAFAKKRLDPYRPRGVGLRAQAVGGEVARRLDSDGAQYPSRSSTGVQ